MNMQHLKKRGVMLALFWGMVAGGVLGIIVGAFSLWTNSDWQKFSEGWIIEMLIVGTASGILFAVAASLIAASVAVFNIGSRRSVAIQIAWIIESSTWIVLGGQEVIALMYLAGISQQMFDFSWPVALFCALFGAGAGWIGLRCAAKDKGKPPLIRHPLLSLASGFVIMQIVVAAVWGIILMIDHL